MTLDAVLDQLRAQAALPPERAESLPPELYWRPEVYELELERIFRRDWSCVGHVSQLAATGDWRRVDLAGEPLLLVRGEDGSVRALSRVCRHRGLDLLCESERASGNATAFERPYHLWSYGLDGRLRGAPEMRGAAGFERASVRLPEFPVEIWQGYIFVCLDRAAAPLAPRLAELDRLLGVDMSGWKLAGTLPWGEYGANWKVVIENAAECYHHLGTHRTTLQLLWPANRAVVDETSSPDFTFGRLVASERFAVQPILLPPRPGLSDEQRAQTLIAGVFPMFFIALGPDSASWFEWTPTGPTSHTRRHPRAGAAGIARRAGLRGGLEGAARGAVRDPGRGRAHQPGGVQRGVASPFAERRAAVAARAPALAVPALSGRAALEPAEPRGLALHHLGAGEELDLERGQLQDAERVVHAVAPEELRVVADRRRRVLQQVPDARLRRQSSHHSARA